MKELYTTRRHDLFTVLPVTAVFLTACTAALMLPAAAAAGMRSGIDSALNVLLPSLFPFMFLSAFASEYGMSDMVGRVLAPFTQAILFLPGEAGVTVLLSLVGGYPVGAVGIAALLRKNKITPAQAKRMLCFCVNPGPAFLISAVGEEMYKNRTLGVLLLISQTCASLIIGIFLGLIARFREKTVSSSKTAIHRRGAADAFIVSTHAACSGAVTLCALVVLFSAFSSLMFTSLRIDGRSDIGMLLRCIFEVTDGCTVLSQIGISPALTALTVGFGGICVHLQIFAALPGLDFSKVRFCISRMVCGLISAVIVTIGEMFITAPAAVYSNIEKTTAAFTAVTKTGSAALLTSSVLFLIFMHCGVNNERGGAYNILQ